MTALTSETNVSPTPLHPEVNSHLSRLATLHEFAESSDNKAPLEDVYRDMGATKLYVNEVYHETLEHRRPREWSKDPENSDEKNAALRLITDTIAIEAHKQSDKQHIDWLVLSNALLNRSQEVEGKDKDTALVSAAISAQFTPEPRQRASFLKIVFGRGMGKDMSQACKASPLILMMGSMTERGMGKNIHTVTSFSSVFEADPKEVDVYLDSLPVKFQKPTPEGLPSDKTIQKQLIASYDTEVLDADRTEIQNTAKEVSMGSEEVTSTMLDLYKVERFALQRVFLQEQMKTVLEGLKEGNPALARELASRRNAADNVISEEIVTSSNKLEPAYLIGRLRTRLEVDTIEAFRKLSEPAMKKFSLEGVNREARDHLTREQAIALRYEEISAKVADHMVISKFIDILEFVEQADNNIVAALGAELGEISIGTVSEDGAAIPEVASQMVANVAKGALADDAPQDIAASELLDFTHSNRRKLLRLATKHFQQFSLTQLEATQPVIRRDEHGTLSLENDFSIFPKDSIDMFSAITLGCPALRLQHPDRAAMTMAERAAHGSSNYIDHVLAVVINEGYARGMFSTEVLRQRAALSGKAPSPRISILDNVKFSPE